MLNRKGIVSIVAVFALTVACMAGLAGCGGATSSEPQSAKDVLDRYAAANPDNCNMKGDASISAGVSGINMDIPIAIDFDVNGETLHGTFSMSLMGAEMKGEMYRVEKDGKYLTYSKADTGGSMFGTDLSSSEGEWTVSESDASAAGDIANLGNEIFANATMEKTDNGYTVSVKGSDAYASFQKAVSQSDDATAEAIPEIPQDYAEFIDGLTLNFAFDKDCNLTEITVPETSSSITASGQTMDITASCNIAVSKHGEIGEITVPDDIANSAKAESASDTDDAASAEAEKAA